MEGLVMAARIPMLPSPAFWRGKRVVVTGHTGFKGGWLGIWLHMLGAKVCGIALQPNTVPNLFESAQVSGGMDSHICNICESTAVTRLIGDFKPEIVLHLAAQPLVRESYRAPLETFSTNLMGTVNVLDALRELDSVRVVIGVTTDKVYGNREWIYPYREIDALGGHDPYSASKAAAEMAIAAYRDAFLAQRGVAVATARAGNVIGGGDWSKDRLIPDAVRAWNAGKPLYVRRPAATRPWQHVLESLTGYLVLVERLWSDSSLASAWNFGPPTGEVATVRDVAEMACARYGRGEIVWGDGADGPHEAGILTLDTSKARAMLGVTSRWSLSESIERTMNWYRLMAEGVDVRALCEADINAFATPI